MNSQVIEFCFASFEYARECLVGYVSTGQKILRAGDLVLGSVKTLAVID